MSYKVSDTDLANLIDGLVRDVTLSLNGIDEGTFSEGTLQTVLNNYSVLFASFESEEENEIALSSFVLSCLRGLSPGITNRNALLFQTRHMLCSVLFCARDAFS